MKIFAAPLQGYTDVAWRHFHAEIYGGVYAYFTPFLRVEKGAMRPQDIRNISSELNTNQNLIPQIIFRDLSEFEILTRQIIECGYKSVDLNLGCPFPPQVKHGRGAALICDTESLKEVSHKMSEEFSDVNFSIKMRLGVDLPEQWHGAIDIINEMPLSHLTVHPRIAIQQYTGDLYIDQFAQLLAEGKHPVVFDGDIKSISDISTLEKEFSTLYGIMIGRGLLMRPSLVTEYVNCEEWDDSRRMNAMMEFHGRMFEYYRDNLCGDAQILSKIKPFWEYLEPEIGHKTAKAIRKATSVNKYLSAVAQI